jgi:hypothetical protein
MYSPPYTAAGFPFFTQAIDFLSFQDRVSFPSQAIDFLFSKQGFLSLLPVN